MDTILAEKMAEIGFIGVDWAIKNHEFNNQTGNLEDSYGYAIYKYGQIYGDPFITNKSATVPKDGKFGHDQAMSFLRGYSADPSGWAVVVCAATAYAGHVEYMYGLDVLQGSELVARQAADKILKNIVWRST